jgi:hypothetical protein
VDSAEDQLAVTELLDAAVRRLKILAEEMDDSSGDGHSMEETSSTSVDSSSSSDDGMIGLLTSVVSNEKFKRRMTLRKLFGDNSPAAAISSPADTPTSPATPLNYEGYFAGQDQDSDEDDGACFSSLDSDDEL